MCRSWVSKQKHQRPKKKHTTKSHLSLWKNNICSFRNRQAAECHTPRPALTFPHFPIHQPSASNANLMCPGPLMKTATQTCPAVSRGCGGALMCLPPPNPPSSPQGADAINPKHTEEYDANCIHLAAASTAVSFFLIKKTGWLH